MDNTPRRKPLRAFSPSLLEPLIDGPSGVRIFFVVPQNFADQHFGSLSVFGLASLNVLGNRPVALAGDKGYRADWIDNFLLELDIQPIIPCKDTDHRDTRPVPFDRESYRERNIIERLIGWLKESRRIATRFEKLALNFLGMIKVAIMQRYLKTAFSDRA